MTPGIRHIAFDPKADNNNGGFWCGNWNSMFLIKRTGEIILTNAPLLNVFGSAYDDQSSYPALTFLWTFSQTGAHQCDLTQYKITPSGLVFTGVVKDVGSVPGYQTGGVAGGLCSFHNTEHFYIVCDIQQNPNLVVAYEISNYCCGGGTTPPGILGYNIYRDSSFLHFNPGPDSLEYYDMNLDPGTYNYNVTALYDLTPYGFPGQTDESLCASPEGIDVEIICGPIIPFLENWSSGTFTYNGWQFQPDQGNWNIRNGKGTEPPYADFSWDPIRVNYSYTMTSIALDASPWYCANMWLEFDLKIADRNITGTESFMVEALYDNTWHEIATFSNNGSFDWTHYQYALDEALGGGLKVRFTASGQQSDNILHWSLDNISIYAVCKPPVDLEYSTSQNWVNLEWTPPDCMGDTSLMGYNIYRTGLDGNPVFTLLNTTPIPDPSYSDDVINLQTDMLKYYVTALYHDNDNNLLCESSTSDTVIVLWEGAGNLSQGGLQIFPNPTFGTLHIISSIPTERIEVIDLYGKRIIDRDGDKQSDITCDMSSFTPGLYYIRVWTNRGVTITKVVIARKDQ